MTDYEAGNIFESGALLYFSQHPLLALGSDCWSCALMAYLNVVYDV